MIETKYDGNVPDAPYLLETDDDPNFRTWFILYYTRGDPDQVLLIEYAVFDHREAFECPKNWVLV